MFADLIVAYYARNMTQERLSLSLSKQAAKRARSKGKKMSSVSAYVEELITEDARREQLRRFIDEHFADQSVQPKAVRQVREELGLAE